MKLPKSWIEARLDEVLNRVDAKIDPQSSSITSHFYVGLEHIESHTGRLLREAEDKTDGSDILSIKTQFKAGDILYGKLRPNLNKVYLAEQDGISSTDIWALRPTDVIIPEFAVHYLRSPAVHVRATQLAAGANLPRVAASSFDRIPIVLPSIPEQQRIVDVMQEAESLISLQHPRKEQLDLMLKSFLDRLVFNINESDWIPLGNLAETRYGTSVSADQKAGFGAPVLRIPNVIGGEVDTTDLKYVGLSPSELARLLLTKQDVLIVRSNGNPDYVGRSAPVTDDIEKAKMVYASYLIRIRVNKDRLLPEYLSSFLNSAFGRAAMRNAIRTTAGQSNLSAENLRKIKIPLPTIAEQKKFAEFWDEVRLLRKEIDLSEHQAMRLREHLTIHAFSGELTQSWREANSEAIATAAVERDELLHKITAKLNKADEPDHRIQPAAPKSVRAKTRDSAPSQLSKPAEHGRPARHWLINELSEFQGAVWNMLSNEWPQKLVVVDDPEAFHDFCTNEQTTWPIEHFNASPNRIRRTLEQLAALGLIAKVSVPRQNAATQQTEYLTAFRPLREAENSRLRDAAMLNNELNPSEKNGDKSNIRGSW